MAAGAAGSDALAHLLLKGDYAHACLMHADQSLAFAADHGFLSRDVFYHQQLFGNPSSTAAGDLEPRTPEPPGDGAARPSVFKPEATSTPAMWSEHPLLLRPRAERPKTLLSEPALWPARLETVSSETRMYYARKPCPGLTPRVTRPSKAR
ncbi:MAG: hypothetical protein U0793_32565 [Gemmataceae bacterium]